MFKWHRIAFQFFLFSGWDSCKQQNNYDNNNNNNNDNNNNDMLNRTQNEAKK